MKVQLPKDKYFYVKTPEEMVEKMKNPVIAAINLTLDRLIDAINSAGADVNEQKEGEEGFLKQYRSSIITYQTLLDKIKNNEELTAYDFSLVALVCKNTSIIMDGQITSLKEASSELSKIAWKLAHMKLTTPQTEEAIQLSKNLTEKKN